MRSCEAARSPVTGTKNETEVCTSVSFFAPLPFGLERSESSGTFASAGGARKSEQKGVAAVEKMEDSESPNIFSGTATGHRHSRCLQRHHKGTLIRIQFCPDKRSFYI